MKTENIDDYLDFTNAISKIVDGDKTMNALTFVTDGTHVYSSIQGDNILLAESIIRTMEEDERVKRIILGIAGHMMHQRDEMALSMIEYAKLK
jgi:hypothetical protein